MIQGHDNNEVPKDTAIVTFKNNQRIVNVIKQFILQLNTVVRE